MKYSYQMAKKSYLQIVIMAISSFAIVEEMASARITESSIAPRQKRSNYIVNIEDWIVAFLKVVEPLYYFFFLAKLQLTRKTKKGCRKGK